MLRMRKKRLILLFGLIALAAFLTWRFVRPMNIFLVSEAFERPVDSTRIPAGLKGLGAEECGECHRDEYEEWSTSIHSQAWTDPYYQVDFVFDGSQQICLNCHIPLDRQQEHKVLGFRDTEKWDPILAPNPDFDAKLQHEGVTCSGCHVRNGTVLGAYGHENKDHPVETMEDSNIICVQCHVVQGERWDTFYRMPPCGTVAEIRAGSGKHSGRSGNLTVADLGELGCVECHMPDVKRPLVEGGKRRFARRHTWRGGHDPEMVKEALTINLEEQARPQPGKRRFVLTLTNSGADHFVPTGTPDRHLTVELRLLDDQGEVLEEERHTLKRTIMWRPFIVDLWDNRLARKESRRYALEFDSARETNAVAVEAVVRYHLLDEARRKRIDYNNEEPIAYDVFRKQLPLSAINPG